MVNCYFTLNVSLESFNCVNTTIEANVNLLTNNCPPNLGFINNTATYMIEGCGNICNCMVMGDINYINCE
jgi:hypothetical protein